MNKAKTKICDTCSIEKTLNNFSQCAGEDRSKREDTCIACKADEQMRKLHEKNMSRLGEKRRKQIERNKRSMRRSKQKAIERKNKALARTEMWLEDHAERKQKQAVVAKTEAEKELARRVLAKRSLLHFIRRFEKNYKAGWVHEDICRRLEKFVQDVADGKDPRLMLFMPPRHGKSMIASHYFPAWALGHHPTFEIIAASYAVSLPLNFSRKVRALIKDPAYHAMFGMTRLSRESQSAETWMTTKGGGYVAAGVGGGITGKGAHILIIDDPVKDAEEADSETQRQSVWDWWGSTAKTRLAPGGGALVIQTRWHDADLSGRLISQMEEVAKGIKERIAALNEELEEETDPSRIITMEQEIAALEEDLGEIDSWEIIKYPAEAEHDEYLTQDGKVVNPEEIFDEEERKEVISTSKLLRKKGEALHPDRFPIGRLRNMKYSMQPRHWAALYQQSPVLDDGSYFTRGMFSFEPTVPDYRRMHKFIAFDLAIGKKQENDWTVGIVGGLDYEGKIHILDMQRGKWDAHEIVETILDMAEQYDPVLVGIEKGQLELAIRPQLNKRMDERKLWPAFAEGKEALKPISDKTVRARPLQGRMQQHKILFPSDQPWTELIINEMLRFPNGVHDDMVDAMAWLVRMMLDAAPPREPGKKRVHKSWRDKLKHYVNGDTRDPMAA